MADAILLTGYALLAVVAILGAVAAHRAADRAANNASRLQQSRGRIVALEHACEALDVKLRKLAGRVYATERPKEPEPEPSDNLPLEERNALIRQRLRAEHGLPSIGARPNGTASEE